MTLRGDPRQRKATTGPKMGGRDKSRPSPGWAVGVLITGDEDEARDEALHAPRP